MQLNTKDGEVHAQKRGIWMRAKSAPVDKDELTASTNSSLVSALFEIQFMWRGDSFKE